jgi:hypothetical protein
MSKPIPAGNVPQRKKSISKSSADKGRKASHGVLAKRHKEERSDSARDNSGRLEKVFEERKTRMGRGQKVKHLTKRK